MFMRLNRFCVIEQNCGKAGIKTLRCALDIRTSTDLAGSQFAESYRMEWTLWFQENQRFLPSV